MKKMISILMACTMLICLAACGNSENTETGTSAPVQPSADVQQEEEAAQQEEPETEEPETEEPKNTKALVVYFSATGNTKAVAEALSKMQGADLYEIVPEQPYTDEDLNYNDSSTRATVEQNDASARPAISGSIDNLEEYDVIYVGYPIWWGDMPRILYTFFDSYDLSGKTIAPFCTSGGSGLSGTAETIESLEPDAVVLEGLHVGDSASSGADSALAEWISGIGQSE